MNLLLYHYKIRELGRTANKDCVFLNQKCIMKYMALLSYISDEDIIKFTKELVDASLHAQKSTEKNPFKNVIDPFSALVDAARQGISLDTWMQQEKSRQIQKSFQNAVGNFHQHILGAVNNWIDAGEGGSYDVISDKKMIIAEIKNKFNTMNSSSQLAAYDKLANWIDYDKHGYTAYIVDIIPKTPKPYCIPFTPSNRNIKRPSRNNLLRIDGRSFYALVTGKERAIDQLYAVLPQVLEIILKIDDTTLTNCSEFKQLFEKAYLNNHCVM